MSVYRQWLWPTVAVLVICAAAGWLFDLRLGSGEVYPPYSSLRADALGTKALYDALDSLPGLAVSRDYRPLSRLAPAARLVLVAGANARRWETLGEKKLQALDRAAENGARIVVVLRAEQIRGRPDDDEPDRDDEEAPVAVVPAPKKKPDDDKKKASAGKDEKKPDKQAAKKIPGAEAETTRTLKEAWHIELKRRWLMVPRESAERTADAPPELPEGVPWRSDLHFAPEPDSPWRVLYRRAGEPVLVERPLGRGSLVLAGDSFFLSNEAMQRSRATPLLSWLVAGQHRIVFAEGELGVLEDNGIGALARRYGLGGALALCVLLGALYAWRRLVPFRPVADDTEGADGIELSHDAGAGVTTLLQRSLDPAAQLAASVDEWKKSRQAGAHAGARLDQAWQAGASSRDPAETYNAIAQALRRR